jgi:GrpB-like predicted nucleotidyltransferase (UPF0157 family)
MSSLYSFTEYSPDWPLEFAREAERLKAMLGDELVDVHHIGSTSVPGLAAKPIIDLLPLVRSHEGLDQRTPVLLQAGYLAWGEYGLPGRRYFTKDRGGDRTHNLHFYPAGHGDVERHLAFCAYLREHAASRLEYEALKHEVYARHPADIAAYSDGKNAWIKRVEAAAIEWYRQQHGRLTRSSEH